MKTKKETKRVKLIVGPRKRATNKTKAVMTAVIAMEKVMTSQMKGPKKPKRFQTNQMSSSLRHRKLC
jgi:hypothetical protein